MHVRVRRLLAGVCAAIVLAAAAPASSAPDPFDIDVVLPLTGGGTFLGQTDVKTLQIFEGLTNREGGLKGQPIHFVFHDDQTNPQVSVQLTNQILAKKPPFVLGSALAAMCRAMAPLFANGPVEYCLSPALHPPKGSFVFSSSASTSDSITAFVRYFRERGWKRIARLTTTDASGQDADNDFPVTLGFAENKDVTVVANEHFNPSDTSVSAQIAKIKASNAQALLIWAPGTPFGTALHAVQDAGLDIPMGTTSANMIYAQMKQYAAIAPKELYFTSLGYAADAARSPAALARVKKFRAVLAQNGVFPDFQSGMAWDAAQITVDALRKLGTTATPEAYRAYVNGLKDYPGIAGMYDFSIADQRGLTLNDIVMMRWDGPHLQWVTVSKFGALPK